MKTCKQLQVWLKEHELILWKFDKDYVEFYRNYNKPRDIRHKNRLYRFDTVYKADFAWDGTNAIWIIEQYVTTDGRRLFNIVRS